MADPEHLNILNKAIERPDPAMWENYKRSKGPWFRANLKGAMFNDRCLKKMNLDLVNLTGGHFQKADLTSASLFNARLKATDFSDAILDFAYLESSNLQFANLTRASLCKAEMRNVTLIGANLQGALLDGAELIGVDARLANFTGTNLQKAIVRGLICTADDAKALHLQMRQDQIDEIRVKEIDANENSKLQKLMKDFNIRIPKKEDNIFISYSKKDEAYVHKLIDYLENKGLSVWLDDKIDFGDRWWQIIVDNIRKCAAMIVVMTPESNDSKWVEKEYLYADEIGKTLFPLLLKGECFPFFVNHQFVNLDEETMPPKEFVDTLRRSVGLANEERDRKKKQKRQVIPDIFTNNIDMEFVLIPAGDFMMGSKLKPEEVAQKYKDNLEWSKPEHPRHKVTISNPIYLQSTPVTQSHWKEVMGNNPSYFRGCGDYCPVENVSWNDVKIFIKKINEIEETDKYRLPTEAEWEYACRAGTTTEFFFGDEESKLGDYAWYDGNSNKKTHPVGKKEPNAWELYDMHGNVYEWVEDEWHDNYEGAPTDGMAWVGEPRGIIQVFRGGSWSHNAMRCRSANRNGDKHTYRSNLVGFRLAKSVEFGSGSREN